jgi:hypothetical protein
MSAKGHVGKPEPTAADKPDAQIDPREMPPAGPHSRPELTNPDLTPGSGMLPDPKSEEPHQQPSG